ncbi:MAG: DUF1800 domain-containing protein [Arcicella sp.]|nr:DUF1800 domain-containing protein [Arcicella sp.]
MAYLATYTPTLTTATAAHLLRRATCGPTKAEIVSFTGLTATQAYQTLFNNVVLNPSPPIDLKETSSTYQQQFVNAPFIADGDVNFQRSMFVKYWWMSQFVKQNNAPSILEKLALFWQNHFVTTNEIVSDCRYMWRYISTIRSNSMGNFRTFVKVMTKDPAMLVYLNGNENVKGKPNENYARELQELFTVGEKDFYGNANYTENDVKAAAEVLTGWYYQNHWNGGSTTIGSAFDANKHEPGNKTFSAKYGNTVVAGSTPATATSGDTELNALTDMLLAHPETAKFICRKLYKWYVNPEVTQDIETNVIIPLADFFKSATNNFAIEPVVEKLLTSDIFYEVNNIGAIIKSPLELALGSLRHFNLPVPNMATDSVAFRKYFEFVYWQMHSMQMSIMDQSSVFGYEPYFQNALSRAWIASSTIAVRNSFTDQYVWRWAEASPTYKISPDLVEWVKTLQPNFLNTAASPSITCDVILEEFSKNMFVTPLFQTQKDFLMDTIMMQGIPRTSWTFEWNAFRTVSNTPTNPTFQDKYNGVRWRLQLLMKYMMRMAEFHVF